MTHIRFLGYKTFVAFTLRHAAVRALRMREVGKIALYIRRHAEM